MKEKLLFLFCVLGLFSSCASDIVELAGSVSGVVSDKITQKPIEGCIVSLSPSNNSVSTTAGGTYAFQDLVEGSYTLTFEKEGYDVQSKEVEVVANTDKKINVFLEPEAERIVSSAEQLNFGDLSSEIDLFLSYSSSKSVSYSIKADADWIKVSPSSGTLSNKSQLTKVIIDRSNLSIGDYSKKLTILTQNATLEIPVYVQKVELSAPKVSNNGDFYELTESSCKVNGLIVGTGGSQITSYGHCWSTKGTPTINDSKTNLGDTQEVGSFTSSLTQLKGGSIYYVRAYAVNALGVSYSNQLVLSVPIVDKPKVSTMPATDINETSAALNAHIDGDGGSKITEYGFYYGTTESTTNKHNISVEEGKTQLKLVLSGLKEGTKYYFKAFAKNSKGEAYGETLTFTTSSENVPVVQTLNAQNVSYKSATMAGRIVDKGYSEVTECGFYYGNDANPSTRMKLSVPSDGKFQADIPNMVSGNTYYYKAYAKNSKGYSYGDVVSVSIPQKPSVKSASFEPLVDLEKYNGYNSHYSYQLKGKAMIDTQGFDIIEAGVVWVGSDEFFDWTDGINGKKNELNINNIEKMHWIAAKGVSQCAALLGNQLTIENEVEMRNESYKGIYVRVYFILADDTVIYGDDVYNVTPTSMSIYEEEK